MSCPIKPLGNRIVVEPKEIKQDMKGGIYIPDSAQEKSQEFVVVSIGVDENADIKINDTVLISIVSGTDVKVENKTYKIVDYEDVLAVLG